MPKTRINTYEMMFLMGPTGSTEPEHALNLCKKVIESHGGQILVIKKWDERKLAYELKKQKRGTYIISFFKAPSSSVAAMERDVRLSEDFLRAMVLRAEHLTLEEMQAVEPQPPAPEKVDRPWSDRPPEGEGRSSRPMRPRRDDVPEGAAKD